MHYETNSDPNYVTYFKTWPYTSCMDKLHSSTYYEKMHHNRQWHDIIPRVGSHVYSRRSNRKTLKWSQKYGKKISYVKKLLNNDSDLWNRTPCRWISSIRSFERKHCLRKVGRHPTTWYQVPEDMNPQTTLREHQSSQTVKCCILFERLFRISAVVIRWMHRAPKAEERANNGESQIYISNTGLKKSKWRDYPSLYRCMQKW